MKDNSHFFVALFILLYHGAISQTSETLKGIVKDQETKELLGLASIILYEKADSIPISFELSDDEGSFEMQIPKNRQLYFLEVTYIGYEAATLDLKNALPQTLIFELRTTSFSIKEVVVKDKQSLKVDKDTVTYQLDRYTDSTETYLSEALSKLPGVEVNDQGNIKVFGQEIQKLLIDGDDLTDRNYQVLTNNLRADLVDEVQVYFGYSDNPLLSGFFNTDHIAMNLVLKAEKKRKINFDPLIGLGYRNRYTADISTIVLYDGLKLLSILQNSNTGKPIQYIGEITENYSSLATHFLLESSASPLHTFNTSYQKEDATRINNTFLLSNKLAFSVHEKLKFRLSLDLPRERLRRNFLNRYEFSNLPTSNYTDSINSTIHLRQQQVQCDMQANLSANSRMEIKLAYDNFLEDNNYEILGREENVHNLSRRTFYSSLVYTKKWNENWVSLLNIDYSQNDQKNAINTATERQINNTFLDVSFFEFTQNAGLASDFFSISKHLLRKTKKEPIQFNIAYLSKYNRYQQHQKTDIENTSSIHQFNLQQHELNTNLKYAHFYKGFKLKYLANAGTINMDEKNNSGISASFKELLYIKLATNIEKKLNAFNTLSMRYTFHPTTPRLTQYFNFNRQIDRYSIEQGMNQAIINTGHILQVDYNKHKPFPYFGLFASAIVHFENRQTVTDIYIDNNFILSRYILKRQNTINANIKSGIEKLLPAISSTIKLKSSISYQQYENLIASRPQTVKNQFYNIHASIKTGLDFPLNWIIGYSNSINLTIIQRGEENNLLHSTQLGYIDFDLQISSKIKLKFSNSLYLYSNRTGNTNDYMLSDISAFFFPQKKRLKIALRIYNLFDTKEIINFTTLDYLQITNRTQLLPRYALATVGYSF